jgi:hypothetical protein
METIKEVLMRRDGMDGDEADLLIRDCKEVIREAIELQDLEMAEGAIQDYFGLEPDYLMELLEV